MADRRRERRQPDPRRRTTLRGVAALATGVALRSVHATAPAPTGTPPAKVDHAPFMARAEEMRRRAIASGDQPYGAVVVKDGVVVGEGVSAVVTANDPTAHAERQAIRDATRRLGPAGLAGCVLYGTSRACPMCEAAAYEAGIARMYFGAAIVDAGAPVSR